jgi:hypothetical protein
MSTTAETRPEAVVVGKPTLDRTTTKAAAIYLLRGSVEEELLLQDRSAGV